MSHDPDLEFLQDRELLELAGLLQTRRLADPPLDPAFRSALRRDLRRRHYDLLQTSTPWWRRLTSGPGLAWGGATAGAVAIAIALVFALHPPPVSSTAFVSSPLDHMRNVAVVQPMKLSFQTDMDHQSVESALQIEPATQVTYNWQGNTLYVQPVAGQLAPNTQYKLTLTTAAKTRGGQPIQQPATITFVTGATPASPSPTQASPSPVPSGVTLGSATELAPAASVSPAWSPDGTTLYFVAPDTSLMSASRAGGSVQSLGLAGVRQIQVTADGSKLAVLTGTGVVTMNPDGTGAQFVALPDALTLAWRSGRLYAVIPSGLVEVKQGLDRRPVVALPNTAQQAAFSPDGGRLLYVDGVSRVHLIDLSSGQDTAWPAVTSALPAWSPDGGRVAFLGTAGLTLAAPDGTGSAPLATLDQLGAAGSSGAALAWSGSAVLVGSANGLSAVDTTFRAPLQLEPGAVTALAAGPAAAVGYVQDGQLWTATIGHPGVEAELESHAATALKAFMDARVAGDSDAANKFLTPAAVQAYQKGTLLFTGERRLARWFGVFQQARPDGSVVEIVRLVLDSHDDVDVQQLDEILTLTANADGSFSIAGVRQTAARPVDAGPEVIGIQVAGGQVQVTFDSDLKPESIRGISLGTATPSYSNRVVTLPVAGANPGDVLTLTIPASVQDLSGRSADQALTVQIVVPEPGS